MEPIEEAKKTMNELCETEKFEELLKYCLELLKDVSQNLSYYDKIRILQSEELALRGLDRHVEADEVSTELMTMPKDDKEN